MNNLLIIKPMDLMAYLLPGYYLFYTFLILNKELFSRFEDRLDSAIYIVVVSFMVGIAIPLVRFPIVAAVRVIKSKLSNNVQETEDVNPCTFLGATLPTFERKMLRKRFASLKNTETDIYSLLLKKSKDAYDECMRVKAIDAFSRNLLLANIVLVIPGAWYSGLVGAVFFLSLATLMWCVNVYVECMKLRQLISFYDLGKG